MAPVSAILHKYGIRMLRYLDDWLILASLKVACLQARDRLLQVCDELGIRINHRKSSLTPSQTLTYLGIDIRSGPFTARPTQARVTNHLRVIEEFLSSRNPPAFIWHQLLGHLSSLTLLVKGGMLRMRPLQLCLRSQWKNVFWLKQNFIFAPFCLPVCEQLPDHNFSCGMIKLSGINWYVKIWK